MKKYKYIISSLLTVILCFSVLKIEPKANLDYNVKSLSYTHGSVSISSCFGNDVTNFMGSTSTADVYNYLSFTFDKYYTGTVTLKWTYNSSAWRQNLTDWNILVIGGKIDSNNNSSGNIVFRVYDQNSFMVIMTYSASTLLSGTDPTFSFTSATSSLTAVTNHNDVYNNIADIETELVSANTSLNGIVSILGALQGLGNTISTNVADIEDYLALESDGTTNTDVERKLNDLSLLVVNMATNLANIRSDMEDTNNNISYLSSINDWLSNIEGEVDGVEELLGIIEGTLVVNGVSTIGTIATNMAAIAAALVPSGTETIYDLVSDIVDQFTDPNTGLIAELTTLNSLVTTTNSKLDDVKTTLNNILTAINGIDNQIDTITWLSNTVPVYDGINTDGSTTFTIPTSTQTFNSSVYCKFSGLYVTSFSRVLFVLRTPFHFSSTLGRVNPDLDIKFYTIYSNTLRENNCDYYYYVSSDYLYIMFSSVNTNVNNIVIKVTPTNNNNSLFVTNNYSINIRYINSNDIEYYTIMSFIDQYNTNKKLLNTLLIDVDSETSLTQYNTDQQTIDIINNNFLTEFNLFKPYVNTTLQPLTSTTFTNEMSNQRTLFDYLFRNLFNLDYNTDDPSTVTNPIFLILIFGGILLALVG